MSYKRTKCWWCICYAAAWLVALIATAVLSKCAADRVLGRALSAKAARDAGYLLIGGISLVASPFVARSVKKLYELDEDGSGTRLNELLDQNVAMLGGAFALVAGVVLIIAELGSTLGMPRATDPEKGILMPELVGFVVAIIVTLCGRWLGSGRWRQRLAWLSCMATLTCFLALGPYFWYQRARTTASEVVQSAFDAGTRSRRGPLVYLERMLVGASSNGNYALLQVGVDRLADTNEPKRECESCLVRLHEYLADDSFGRSIVTQGLNSIREARPASSSFPPGGRGWPHDQWWRPKDPQGAPDCRSLGDTTARVQK